MNYLEETLIFCGRLVWNTFITFISFVAIAFGGLIILKPIVSVLPKEWSAGIELPYEWLLLTLLFIPLPIIAALVYSLLISIFMHFAEGEIWFSDKIRAATYCAFTPIYIASAELWCQSGNLCYI